MLFTAISVGWLRLSATRLWELTHRLMAGSRGGARPAAWLSGSGRDGRGAWLTRASPRRARRDAGGRSLAARCLCCSCRRWWTEELAPKLVVISCPR